MITLLLCLCPDARNKDQKGGPMVMQRVMQQVKQFAAEKAAASGGGGTFDDVVFGDSNLAHPAKRQKVDDSIQRYDPLAVSTCAQELKLLYAGPTEPAVCAAHRRQRAPARSSRTKRKLRGSPQHRRPQRLRPRSRRIHRPRRRL